MPFLYRASLNKWWFDELNHLLFMVIGGRLAYAMWWFDRNVVDGTVNSLGRATVASGRGLRQVQTGRVQNYALGIAIGLIVMAGVVPRRWRGTDDERRQPAHPDASSRSCR